MATAPKTIPQKTVQKKNTTISFPAVKTVLEANSKIKNTHTQLSIGSVPHTLQSSKCSVKLSITTVQKLVSPEHKTSQFCCCWNLRSLNNKIQSVTDFLSDRSISLLFVTETWMTSMNNVTATTKLYGFSMIHQIRNSNSNKSRGGGVNYFQLSGSEHHTSV